MENTYSPHFVALSLADELKASCMADCPKFELSSCDVVVTEDGRGLRSVYDGTSMYLLSE